ncbi:MAG: RagB/SusD family nutrient uptake outer membrane protein [Bacteroidales bacterium]|nr:RagB/SusD family nutrient uptake outer membrane protein [Bacteroidales bacterium]
MKKNILNIAIALIAVLSLSSCEKFLNRPAEDTYNRDNFYQTPEQCIQGVNYLYNSPWYDVIRGFYRVGECFSGNYYMGDSPYLQFSVNGSDKELRDMSSSLWAVNAQAGMVYNRIKESDVDETVKHMCMGEALVWKAFANFFLVRSFGEVPIIHNISETLAEGGYNEIYKATKEDVYQYTVMLLEKAMELLPKKVANKDGRIDYYSAEALLAKVYLQKAGVSGSLNQADLDKAAEYAKDVIQNSGRQLMENYSDIFRMQNNKNIEAMISWHWDASAQPWTAQNSFQSDLAPKGFDEFGDCWGGWTGPSIALQEQFGINILQDPALRSDVDTRRKATMMLPGDKYEYFFAAQGGLDYLRFFYDDNFGPSGSSNASDKALNSPTGATCVKFLYGDGQDHMAALGVSASRMAYGLSTHILRLADIYLVYAEAKLHGPGSSTSDPLACDVFFRIRKRAIPTLTDKPSSITFEQVWKERNLELALEGDRWYDYVRVGYYNPDFAVADIQSQRRNGLMGTALDVSFDATCKAYYETGVWNASGVVYNTDENPIPTKEAILSKIKALPFPSEDVVFNPNLEKPAQAFDFSTITF